MEYNRLLLSAGGGIFSVAQQASQAKNVASVFIGLGGTGVDCLATLRKEINKRLKPDDPTAPIPTYNRIQFLGVDTDIKSKDIIGVTNFFSISMNDIKGTLSNRMAINARYDLNWLRSSDIPVADLGLNGAGAIRQVGRMMLMDKSALFVEKLKSKIKAAKEGLGSPQLNIHIISGIGGGTGSGAFLDVCYLVRSLASDPAIGKFTSFGYVFLPDVNLTKQIDSLTEALIKRNGYAALQEIDYCMNIEHNGGKFYQEYAGGRTVAWDQDPVDMCHLISATNTSSDTIKNPYKYAQSVVTEYIMDFLIQPADQEKFGIMSQLSNFTAKVGVASSSVLRGTNLRYCTLGAACATLPLTEINTYLASHLFKEFVENTKNIKPNEHDVKQLAIDTLAPTADSVADIYSKLFDEITAGVANLYFEAYDGAYQDLLPDNNGPFINWYAGQEDTKIGQLTLKVESLIKGNDASLIERIKKALKRVICGDGDRTPPKGPRFAYQMLFEGSEFNLSNIISSLIVENEQKLLREQRQLEDLKACYEESEDIFLERSKRRMLDNDKKRFDDYETDMMNYASAKYSIEVYKRIANLLDTLQRQIREENDKFFAIFKRVMENLSSTFELNSNYLESVDHLDNSDSFYVPMMTIDELKPAMDSAIKALNFDKMFGSFLNVFFDNVDKWIDENENKISKLVTDFFIGTAFEGFANKNITDFLADKYGTTNTTVLSNNIYNDYITNLASKSQVLFPFDTGLTQVSSLGYIKHISAPTVSAEIQNAANTYIQIDSNCEVNSSDLTDRIYMLNTACAFPLGSYAPGTDYEQVYFNSTEGFGNHYYEGERSGGEGKLLKNMIFKDWRKLPPLRPQSIIDMNVPAPERMKEIVRNSRNLYERGKALGFIDEERKIYSLDEKAISVLEEKTAKAAKILEELDSVSAVELDKILSEIEREKDIKPSYSGYSIYNLGALDEESQKRIVEDYFTYSPVLNIIVQNTLNNNDKLQEIIRQFESIKKEAAVKNLGLMDKFMPAFFEPFCAGVFTFEGINIYYKKVLTGREELTKLSEMDEENKFWKIPVYQAFINYQRLSPEIKDDIKQDYTAVLKSMDAEKKAAAQELATRLGEQTATWVSIAESYDEKKNIIRFIDSLNKSMQDYLNTIKYM